MKTREKEKRERKKKGGEKMEQLEQTEQRINAKQTETEQQILRKRKRAGFFFPRWESHTAAAIEYLEEKRSVRAFHG